MPSNKPDHFSSANLSQLQSQLAIWSDFASKYFEHAGKLAELNMNACKSIFEETALATQQLQASQDPQTLLSLTSNQAQPQIEKALLYGRQLGEIMACMQTDLANVVKAEVEESQQSMAKIAETSAVGAPNSMPNMADLMKSALDNVNAGYEQFMKTAQESTEAAQGNFLAAAKPIKKATGRSKPH